ncbi:WXG100 family type VII secretion target [Collinsella intestinalis]|uniref:WXG100 family type VII secretion target n=1 Tax=Collinsella intestinalis TaxID=147207 RepID=UPI0022E1C3DE|nr:WXG100 family type VII secretion target [Collinsella intestinalis]
MVAGEIVVDREQALSAVEGYDSEARELKAINDLIAAVSSALEGAWEGRAAANAMETLAEASSYMTSAQDSLLRHSGYVKQGADAFMDMDKAIAASNQSATPVCGEISRYIH